MTDENPAPPTPDEQARLDALAACDILDTCPEPAFDDLARLAAQVCQAPAAFVTFVDDRRQFFKASVGGEGAREATREMGFCPLTVRQGRTLVIPDTLADAHFHDNPAATADPPARAYAGVPIRDAHGLALGTLCVTDQRPRDLTPEQIEGLRALGRQAEALLELRRVAASERRAREQSALSEARLRGVTDALPVLIAYVDAEERYRFNNRAYEEWMGVPREQVTGRTMKEVLGDDLYDILSGHVAAALAGETVSYERDLTWPDGTRRSVRGTYVPQQGTDGRVVGFAILVTDETETRRREAERRIASERQAILMTTQRKIAGMAQDLDAILTVVTRSAQELSGADGAVVEMADGDDMVYRAASGTAAAHVGLRLRRATSLSGRCVAEGRLLYCEDSEADARVDREACRRIGVRSMVVVPLQYLGHTVGVLKVYAAAPRAFATDVLPLLELTVSMIVAALGGVSEAEARRALAVSEERQWTLLRDVLASVTEGRLLLSSGPAQLPVPLAPVGDPIPLTRGGGLRDLRLRAQEAAQVAGHSEERQFDLLTAVSEAGMNAVLHGGGGLGQVMVGGDGTVQVRVEDHGGGIAMENLPRATLSRGFSTKATLGHGLKMMLETTDRLFLLTGPTGTTVVLEHERERPLPAWL